MTVSKFLCELGRLQGVSYLINGFGVSIKIPRNSSKIKVCNPASLFARRRRQEKDVRSGPELGRPLR